MRRRDFVGVVGTAAGMLLVEAASAAADRIRVLPAVEPADAPGVEKIPAFQAFLGTLKPGDLRAHGALSVLWLHAPASSPVLDVATFDEARGRAELVVTERPQAAVSTLVTENRGKRHVLLLAGEIVLGGKQNRVVAHDVLLPPLSGPREITVFCVEQGRWAGNTKDFGGQGTFAAPALRSELLAKPTQAQVWQEVDRTARRAAAPSPTGSYQAVFDKPDVKAHQEVTERVIDRKMPAGACGAAVFVGESFAGLDLFQDVGLFAREWLKLLRAHAVETYGRPQNVGVSEAALRAEVNDLLGRAAGTPGLRRATPGAGALFELRVERRRGTVLVAEGQVVHAALL